MLLNMMTFGRKARFLAICAVIPAAIAGQAAAVETIRVNSVTPNDPGNVDTKKIMDIAERVKEKSNGELVLEIHYSSSLVPHAQAFEAVTQGLIDAYYDSPNHAAGRVPEADIFSLPLNFADHDDFVAKTRGCIDAILDERYAAQGARFVGSYPGSGTTIIMSRDRLAAVSDLEGKKIRVFGPAMADLMTEVGASPVYIPFPELEVALNRGVADGYMTSWGTMATFPGIRKESKYVIWPPVQGSLATGLVLNKARYDSLAPELQTALDEAVDEAIRAAPAFLAEQEDEARELLAQHDVEIVDLPEEEAAKLMAAAEPVWNSWAEKVAAADRAGGEARAERLLSVLREGCGA